MGLSMDLISQFVKATKDTGTKKTETIVYGTAKDQNGTMFVRFDGSTLMTPVIATADTKDGDRVTVMIKNHTAIITGNVTSPAARTHDVKDIKADVDVDLSAINTALTNQINTVTAQGKLLTHHGDYLKSLELRADSQAATVKDVKTVVDMITAVAEEHDLDVDALLKLIKNTVDMIHAVAAKYETNVQDLLEKLMSDVLVLRIDHDDDYDKLNGMILDRDFEIAALKARVSALEIQST